MNKLKLTIFTIVITLFSIYSSPALYANVFAHNVRITQPTSSFPFDGNFADGSGAGIRFTLSDYADTVNINIYDGSMNMVRSILALDLNMGENVVEWDGMNDAGAMVIDDSYSLEIYTASAGHDAYTVLYDKEVPIYTRGVTSMKSQAAKNFGFTYSASGGGYASGVTRHTNDMAQFGDTPGNATLSVTYTDTISAVGSDNLRYSSEADNDGYVYLARRSSTVPGIYRYHVDSLVVELVDSGGYGGAAPQGIAIGGTGSDQIIIVTDWNGKVHSFLNDGSTISHTKQVLLDDSTAIFWDATTAKDSGWLYVTYQAVDTSFLPGVAAFDFSTFIPGSDPLTLADAAWTVEAPDTAHAGTIAYSKVDDQLYVSFVRRPHAAGVQGIYAVTDLDGTPTMELVRLDPEDNIAEYRGDVATDAAGNIIFFENSNEFITLISPPTGQNSYLYKDMFTTIDVSPSESIASIRVDDDGDGSPDRLGEVVTVKGIVTSYSFAEGNYLPVTLQDETGAIYLYGLYDEGSYNLGDILQVTGTVAFYNGLTELDVDKIEDITVIGTTLPIEPMELTLHEWLSNPEKYESMLISVKALEKASGDWPADGSNANITVTDGVMDFTMRIDKDLDLDGQAEPVYPINLTGVTSQFSSEAPYNTGYQIFPRMYSDIEQGVATAPNSNFALLTPEDGATLYITDSTDTFTATWDAAVDLDSNTTLMYQWFLTDGSFQSGALTEPTFSFTGEDLYGLLGTAFDSITVSWTVRTTDGGGVFVSSIDTFSVTLINGLVVGVDQETIPNKFFVDQNYPNPFNPSTTIKFGLPAESVVNLVIYDVLGREVRTLVNNKSLKAGTHSYAFNASSIASGTYIYRLTTENNVVTKKMLLLK